MAGITFNPWDGLSMGSGPLKSVAPWERERDQYYQMRQLEAMERCRMMAQAPLPSFIRDVDRVKDDNDKLLLLLED